LFIFDYLNAESNNIFTSSQFGFRKNHSTLHTLIHFVNDVSSALNKKHHAISIFCDLRKAFDTVEHHILLKKFKKIEVGGGVELDWFKGYLHDRKQFVFIMGNAALYSPFCLGSLRNLFLVLCCFCSISTTYLKPRLLFAPYSLMTQSFSHLVLIFVSSPIL
jgi:hypothetical protein